MTRAQQNGIWEALSPSGESTLLWFGDRWQQSPDGTKGHDPQTVLPLVFNADNSIQPIVWQDRFIIDVGNPLEIAIADLRLRSSSEVDR